MFAGSMQAAECFSVESTTVSIYDCFFEGQARNLLVKAACVKYAGENPLKCICICAPSAEQ